MDRHDSTVALKQARGLDRRRRLRSAPSEQAVNYPKSVITLKIG